MHESILLTSTLSIIMFQNEVKSQRKKEKEKSIPFFSFSSNVMRFSAFHLSRSWAQCFVLNVQTSCAHTIPVVAAKLQKKNGKKKKIVCYFCLKENIKRLQPWKANNKNTENESIFVLFVSICHKWMIKETTTSLACMQYSNAYSHFISLFCIFFSISHFFFAFVNWPYNRLVMISAKTKI